MRAEVYESEIYQERVREQEHLPIVRRVWLEGLTYQCSFVQELYTWEEARGHLKELSMVDGYHWRLPTLGELERLLIKAPHKNLKGDEHYVLKSFLDFMPHESIFWSSSTENRVGVWVVDFSKGYYCLRDKTAKHHLLAVCESKLV